MSFYVKVGDENTEIPESCDKCYICQDIYSSCDACLLIAEQIGDSHASDTTIPHKYYCAADCNRIIQDISKRPEWCPIIQEVKKDVISQKNIKEWNKETERVIFIPRNGEVK